jgi:phosphoribosylformimino-5-aminoimidazole carboxamide ribotide isomerase
METRVQYDGALRLLPVIDLLDGQVVAARAGQRQHYAPICTPLASGSAPGSILAALLARCPGDCAYVADLDAIMSGRPQMPLLRALLDAFPRLQFWLDAGFASAEHGQATALALAPARPERVLPVLGTESLRQCADLSGGAPCALSLDFGAEGFRGDPEWLRQPGYWPDRVIVMTLAEVGTAGGPNLRRLRECRTLAGGRAVYAAGGVRGAADLAALAELGVAGALVATALHRGTLPVAPAGT